MLAHQSKYVLMIPASLYMCLSFLYFLVLPVRSPGLHYSGHRAQENPLRLNLHKEQGVTRQQNQDGTLLAVRQDHDVRMVVMPEV